MKEDVAAVEENPVTVATATAVDPAEELPKKKRWWGKRKKVEGQSEGREHTPTPPTVMGAEPAPDMTCVLPFQLSFVGATGKKSKRKEQDLPVETKKETLAQFAFDVTQTVEGHLWTVLCGSEDDAELTGFAAFKDPAHAATFSACCRGSGVAVRPAPAPLPIRFAAANRLLNAPLPFPPLARLGPNAVFGELVLETEDALAILAEDNLLPADVDAAVCEAAAKLASPVPVWPTDGTVNVLRRVGIDFGRSHFLLADGTLRHAQLVRQYVYDAGGASSGERRAFFTRLGFADAEAAIAACAEGGSWERAEVITRAKYELLVRWLEASGWTGDCHLAALRAMLFNTQRYLGTVKATARRLITEAVPDTPPECLTFCAFQARLQLPEPGAGGPAALLVTLVNHRPDDGAWQAVRRVPVLPQARVRAAFTLPLDGASGGRLCVRVTPVLRHVPLAEDQARRFWGVVDCTTGEVVKYCDTCPTW
eukprot:TRINITY_DN1531_c0_g1_i1.p1 TRINITY_DN1531_c0_g1~~TRINITY_DN1531_c0_g1_i1.p1  ORF type:complete len:480 (+),score=119.55 TRINITY_DN1531_c0_g1_i1:506-1945(+)